MTTANGTLTTKVMKTGWTVPVEADIADAIIAYGEEAVYHCFILGASLQFYRHINGLVHKLGTTKARKLFEAKSFNPSAPTRKTPGAKILEKLSPEARLEWATQVQNEAIVEINEKVEGEELLAHSGGVASSEES